MASEAVRFHRRTQLYRSLEAEGVRWGALPDAAFGEAVGWGRGGGDLIDLTPLPRLGFKGRGTIPAMRERGIVVEPVPNRVFRQADGGLCLVLAPSEVLLLADVRGTGAREAELESTWRLDDGERTYPVPRRDSHCWFALLGTKVPALFAKLCAVDLLPAQFPDCASAQTSVARLNAIVARVDIGVAPLFHLLADSASAVYLWNCLRDAGSEFDAGVAGVGALRELAGR
jgi:sarcosine oxidase subunit gamma